MLLLKSSSLSVSSEISATLFGLYCSIICFARFSPGVLSLFFAISLIPFFHCSTLFPNCKKCASYFSNLHTLFYNLRCSNKNSTLLFSHKLTKSKRLYFVKKRNKRDYKSNNINAIFCKYYKFRGVLI